MPFCPSCRAEYLATYSECRDCDVQLVKELTHPEIELPMGDIYICYDPFQANRIADLLRHEGIETLIRDRSCSQFPTTLGTSCEQHIAVLQERVIEAHLLIETAIQDHVIPGDGLLIEGRT